MDGDQCCSADLSDFLFKQKWYASDIKFSCLRESSVLADLNETEDEESSVTLCQIRVQFAGSDGYDERTLLLLLAELKNQDFSIGQPVWGPADTLLYLCEHRLKAGLKQSKVDKELNRVIKNSPVLSGRLVWTCAWLD